LCVDQFTVSTFIILFYFEQKKDHEGPEAALSGGLTSYKEDHRRKGNNNQILHICKKDPKNILENAIQSYSTEEDEELNITAACTAVGDGTT
jgi:hypothetical protein